jgi:hypothetical protein
VCWILLKREGEKNRVLFTRVRVLYRQMGLCLYCIFLYEKAKETLPISYVSRPFNFYGRVTKLTIKLYAYFTSHEHIRLNHNRAFPMK